MAPFFHRCPGEPIPGLWAKPEQEPMGQGHICRAVTSARRLGDCRGARYQALSPLCFAFRTTSGIGPGYGGARCTSTATLGMYRYVGAGHPQQRPLHPSWGSRLWGKSRRDQFCWGHRAEGSQHLLYVPLVSPAQSWEGPSHGG